MMIVERDFQTCSALSSVILSCLNYISRKKTQPNKKKHCLLLFVGQDVGVCLLGPADELVTRSRGRYCRGHTPTALHSPDLELQFTSRRELLRDTLCIFPLPPPSLPTRLSISACITIASLSLDRCGPFFCFLLQFLFCVRVVIGRLLQLCKRFCFVGYL